MELHYFLSTNGSRGHYSFTEKELTNTQNNIVLSGYPRQIAEILIKECYTIAKQNRMQMHIIHNCLDNSVEGIIFPELQSALMNLPINEPRFDVSSLFKNEHLLCYEQHLEAAFGHFLKAKEIHDDWEQIYINVMDFDALDAFTDFTVERLLGQQKTNHAGTFADRFFGSATINGSLDYVNVLVENTKQCFIKGRPGTGKSTMMKKIAQEAFERGFHVERYHCSFDPNSLDMVVIRELSLSLFDATSPHEYFPSKNTDEILDLYAVSIPKDTDAKYQNELTRFARDYKQEIDDALKELIAANAGLNRAEESIRKLIDDNKLMDIRKNIIKRIFP